MPYYSTGTASTIAGQAVVTGTGTAWALSLVSGGMFNSRGFSVPIKSVESNQSLTLEYPWPGTSFSGAYAVDLDRAEAASAVIANRRLAELLAKVETMTGPPGARGRDGPTTVNIGETVTVPYDQGAEVINVGDARDVLLEFRVPIGPQGELSAQDRAFFNAAVEDASQSATTASAAAQDTGADRVQTTADRVQTGQDRVATGEDRAAIAGAQNATAADRAQTALDRTATGQDRTATAADAVKTGQDRAKTTADVAATAADRVVTSEDRVKTTADVAATAADRVKTTADVVKTAADVVKTGQDRAAIAGAQEATADDRVQTGQDRTKTTADVAATAADRVQTGQDRAKTTADAAATTADATATAADRVQTGQDKAATAADRVATGQDKVATAADLVKTGQDRAAIAGAQEATAADRVQTGQDRTAVAADRVQTGQDRAATTADRAQTGQDRAVAVDAATASIGSAEAAFNNKEAAKTFRQETAADRAAVAADRVATADDRVGTGQDRTATAADRALAQTAKSLSESYATAPVDTQVEPGKYSAYHWSEKSRLSSLGSAANVTFIPADGMTANDVQEALLEVWNNVPEVDLTNYATTAQLAEKVTGPATSNIGDLAQFSGTDGKTLMRKSVASVLGTALATTGAVRVSPLDTDQFGLSDTNEIFRRVTWLNMKGYIKTFVDSFKAVAFGYASLDGSGKVLLSQIPDTLLGNVNYQGAWNAATNSPAIPAAATANKGHYRIVNTTGNTNINGITDWRIGDWIISDGVTWGKIDNTDAVWGVAGLVGDIPASALKTALAYTVADLPGLQADLDGRLGAVEAAAALKFHDTRNVVDSPTTLRNNALSFDFKATGTAGDPPVNRGGYSYIVSAKGWSDASGGVPVQLSLGDGIAIRSAADMNTWGAWRTMWHSGNLNPSDFALASGLPIKATGNELLALTNDAKFLTPKSVADADAWKPLVPSYNGSNPVDLALGRNFSLAVGAGTGIITIAAPTNAKEGMTGAFQFLTNSSLVSSVAWNAFWKFGVDGVPAVLTGGKQNRLAYVFFVVEPGAASAVCTFKLVVEGVNNP